MIELILYVQYFFSDRKELQLLYVLILPCCYTVVVILLTTTVHVIYYSHAGTGILPKWISKIVLLSEVKYDVRENFSHFNKYCSIEPQDRGLLLLVDKPESCCLDSIYEFDLLYSSAVPFVWVMMTHWNLLSEDWKLLKYWGLCKINFLNFGTEKLRNFEMDTLKT